MKTKEDFEDEMVEAMINSANNFGPAMDMYHPDYGWILKDGKVTPEGHQFREDNKEQFETYSKTGRC